MIQVLKTLSELMADMYDRIVLCPLDDERDLLLSAGEKSDEIFFEACRQVFGMNMLRAYHQACIHVIQYCDFLHDHFDEYIAESSAALYIDHAGVMVDAIEYLCEYAPIDTASEKGILSSRAACARLCYNGLKQRCQTHQKSMHQKRT